MVFALLLLFVADFDEAFRVGLLALQRNDLGAAQTSLETAAKLAPANGRVQIALAQTYRKLNNFAKADAAALQASLLGRQDAVVQQSLSIYYFEAVQPLLQKQKFAEVVGILTRARVENSAQLRLALGVAYYGLRQFDEAATAFLATIAVDPSIEQPYVFLGKSLDQIPGRLAEVDRVFVSYQEGHPDRALGYLLHAKASTDLDLSQKLLEKALSLEESASAHFELGALFFRKQLFGDAAREFERSAALDPRNATTHYRLAQVYGRLGKSEAARLELELHARLVREQEMRNEPGSR